MEPFNIKIKSGDQPVVLTILPTDMGYYKVIYYAAILAAIANAGDEKWTLIAMDEIEAGDLPFYIAGADPERVEPELDAAFITQVGSAIEAALKEQA